MSVSEKQLQADVADYLCLQYPDVLFHSDYGSGVKLTPRQAATQKRQNGGRRAWPDMFIAESVPEDTSCMIQDNFTDIYGISGFNGLFLELKKKGTKLIRDKDARKVLKGETRLRKKGDWWNSHIEEQAKVLQQLRERGYVAEFAIGAEEAKKIIDEYLGGRW